MPAVVVLGFGALFLGIIGAAAFQLRGRPADAPEDGPDGPDGPGRPECVDPVDSSGNRT